MNQKFAPHFLMKTRCYICSDNTGTSIALAGHFSNNINIQPKTGDNMLILHHSFFHCFIDLIYDSLIATFQKRRGVRY